LLPGSNLKIRFNAPSPGFAFQPRECATSRREFLRKNFFSREFSSHREYYQDFASRQDSHQDPRGEFFLGGILMSTDEIHLINSFASFAPAEWRPISRPPNSSGTKINAVCRIFVFLTYQAYQNSNALFNLQLLLVFTFKVIPQYCIAHPYCA